VNIPKEEEENDGLIKVKQNKKTGPLKIEGKSVQAFYNYLVNNPGENKIVAPCVFMNAQFRSLGVTGNSEICNMFDGGKTQFRLSFAGPITREAVAKLCQVLEKTQNSFTLEVVYEPASGTMPGSAPSKICKREGALYDITK
jgi:hypothetical protein